MYVLVFQPDMLLHVVPVMTVVRWPVGDHHPLLGTPLGSGHTNGSHQHRGHSNHGPGSHLDPSKALLLLAIGLAVQAVVHVERRNEDKTIKHKPKSPLKSYINSGQRRNILSFLN